MVSQVFLIFTLVVWFVLVADNRFIYAFPQVATITSDLPRWLWAIAFGLAGFTLAAFFASFEEHNDHFKSMGSIGFAFAYGGLHGVSTLVSSTLVYSILTVLPSTQGFIYYFFSAAASLYMGLIADIYLISKLGIKR